jgi:hypothetical protein
MRILRGGQCNTITIPPPSKYKVKISGREFKVPVTQNSNYLESPHIRGEKQEEQMQHRLAIVTVHT